MAIRNKFRSAECEFISMDETVEENLKITIFHLGELNGRFPQGNEEEQTDDHGHEISYPKLR